MTPRRPRRPPPPLDQARLNELALSYVARFATSEAKLAAYLQRKLNERGWTGAGAADLPAMVARFASAGLVDDSAFALAKAQSLTRRGYGRRRVEAALRVAGVDEECGAEALDHADREAAASALRFAERRRLGPFARAEAEQMADRRKRRDKQLSAMVRAGHDWRLANAILSCPPGAVPEPAELVDRNGHSDS